MPSQCDKVELSRPELSALPSRPVLTRHCRTSPTSIANILVMLDKQHRLSVNRICTKNLDHHPSQKSSELHRSVTTESPNILERPASRPRYMEFCTDFLLYATSTTTSTTPCIATAVTITASIAPLREGTAHRRISYPTLTPSSASAVSLVTVIVTAVAMHRFVEVAVDVA